MSALRQLHPAVPLKTDRDYFALSDDTPAQLLGGSLVVVPAPSPYHQRISKNLMWHLVSFVEKERELGEVFAAPIDVRLGQHDVFQPDIIVLLTEQAALLQEAFVDGAPAVVIEILSPSTAYYDLRYKKKVYASTGVQEYWVVDPMEQSIEIYAAHSREFSLHARAEGEASSISSWVLEGFSVSLAEVF